jgi:hypothetical protein
MPCLKKIQRSQISLDLAWNPVGLRIPLSAVPVNRAGSLCRPLTSTLSRLFFDTSASLY